MSVVNPEYDPNWETRYEHHSETLKSIEAERQRLYETDTSGNIDRLNELDRLAREHLNELQSCLSNYQHETIQDAARWVFENFDPNMSAAETFTVHAIDIDSFTSIADINAAWVEANEISEQRDADVRNKMTVGMPDGQDIFMETGNNSISSMWQTFETDELFPNTHYRDPFSLPVTTLLTIDERDGEYHICFMQKPKNYEGSVEPNIEHLAAAMYRRINDNSAHEGATENTGLLARLKSAFSSDGHDEKVSASKMHFYIHHTPKPTWPERFSRVDMTFHRGHFSDPSWHQYSVIPEAIQNARHVLGEVDITNHASVPNLLTGGTESTDVTTNFEN